MIFGTVAPLLMVGAGAAVEVSTWQSEASRLQEVADAAALGTASELSLANARSDVIRDLAMSFVLAEYGDHDQPPTVSVAVLDDNTAVEVVLTQPRSQLVSQFIGVNTEDVRARAVARVMGSTNICVIGLASTGGNTIALEDNSQMTAGDCAIYSNSTNGAGIKADRGATVTASLICSAGGVNDANADLTPEPVTDCPPIEDPLAGRPAPRAGSCDFEAVAFTTGRHVLGPGVYCGGLTIGGTANVELRSGVYVMRNGPLLVTQEARLRGEYVGFYLTSSGTVPMEMPTTLNLLMTMSSETSDADLIGDVSTSARQGDSVFHFGVDTEIDLSAPRDGPMAGLLFYEDPASPEFQVNEIFSNGARNLLGTIYLPNGRLYIDADAPIADQSAYTVIVARRVELYSGPNLVLNTDYGATDVPVPDGVGPTNGGRIALTQ